MKKVTEVKIRFSFSVYRVIEVSENDVDLAEELPSLVNLLGGWLRSRISRLFRAKLRDVLSSFGAWFVDCLLQCLPRSLWLYSDSCLAFNMLGNYII